MINLDRLSSECKQLCLAEDVDALGNYLLAHPQDTYQLFQQILTESGRQWMASRPHLMGYVFRGIARYSHPNRDCYLALSVKIFNFPSFITEEFLLSLFKSQYLESIMAAFSRLSDEQLKQFVDHHFDAISAHMLSGTPASFSTLARPLFMQSNPFFQLVLSKRENKNFLQKVLLSSLPIEEKIQLFAFIKEKAIAVFQRLLKQDVQGENILYTAVHQLNKDALWKFFIFLQECGTSTVKELLAPLRDCHILNAIQTRHKDLLFTLTVAIYDIDASFVHAWPGLLDLLLETYEQIKRERTDEECVLETIENIIEAYPDPAHPNVQLMRFNFYLDELANLLNGEKLDEALDKLKALPFHPSATNFDMIPPITAFFDSFWRKESIINNPPAFSPWEGIDAETCSLFLPLFSPSSIASHMPQIIKAIESQEGAPAIPKNMVDLKQSNYFLLSLAAANPDLHGSLLDILPDLSPVKIKVIIPQLSKESLFQFLQARPAADPRLICYVAFATSEQLDYCFKQHDMPPAILTNRPAFFFLLKNALVDPFQTTADGNSLIKIFMRHYPLPVLRGTPEILNPSDKLGILSLKSEPDNRIIFEFEGEEKLEMKNFTDPKDFFAATNRRREQNWRKGSEQARFYSQLVKAPQQNFEGQSFCQYLYQHQYSPYLASNLFDLAHSLDLVRWDFKIKTNISDPQTAIHIDPHSYPLLYPKIACLIEAFLFENDDSLLSDSQKFNIIERMFKTAGYFSLKNEQHLEAFKQQSILIIPAGFRGHHFNVAFFRLASHAFRIVDNHAVDTRGILMHCINPNKIDLHALESIQRLKEESPEEGQIYLEEDFLTDWEASSDHPICSLFRQAFNKKSQSDESHNCVFRGVLANFNFQYAFEALQGKELDQFPQILQEVKKQSEWARLFISLSLIIDAYQAGLKQDFPFDPGFEWQARKEIEHLYTKFRIRNGPPSSSLASTFAFFQMLAGLFKEKFKLEDPQPMEEKANQAYKKRSWNKREKDCVLQ
ncbi:hypothetical protein [Candidatus Protochlamydia phocaeensis]|uniref:hypothetical protein n=1 Tax=Candidatus Protochlamydia phocaeensis TaxID=1414722 RepID=UPI000837CA2B|nr:hypothetical protein [Candidatus Protochlamydia phocaeensis]